ncbi:HPr family phosphocarrier protein [Hyphobacterium sp. HN65]|uniref:HPr family phosphocarrier protein n=1 Tax=Hyphobacterium lacteum TaxID=3116575 RepID=A0ABU7LST5_9PROT|nr:HPr family phosphocarrier protein [Hyphobacterium sp. HN65]MEE2526982.1 HPr family phosphocarrier protein [Hyphobacterium sp. HN65]
MPHSRRVTICNERGLHARASAKFVDLAADYDARVQVQRGDEKVEASSIMDLLMLAAGHGTDIVIHAEGPQAEPALEALVKLVEDRFHESA